MRTSIVKDVATEAHDDPNAPGQVVVRLKGVGNIGTSPRFRLKLVDAPLGDPRWPDADHAPVEVRETGEGVHVTIGAALACHAMLAPGTAVLMEIGDMRGEFLWPAVTLAQQPRRKRVALRVVAPPAVTITPAEAATHTVSTAILDFERTNDAAPIDAPPVLTSSSTIKPAPIVSVPATITPEMPEAATVVPDSAPSHVTTAPELMPASIATPSLSAFRHIDKDAAREKMPSIFSAEEWPTTARAMDNTPAQTGPVPSPVVHAPYGGAATERRSIRPGSDVFPTAPDNDVGDVGAPKRPARLPLPTLDTPSAEATPAPATAAIADATAAAPQSKVRTVLTHLDQMPALAAAALGFAVLSAIAAGAMLWTGGRSTDARGVAFQDQRRWQDGQVQKPAVVKSTPPAEPAIKSAGPPPPVVTASTALPVPVPMPAATATPCLAAEPKTTALPAGMMSIGFRSSCHRQQPVMLAYGGLEFKRRFDVDGGLDVTIDCIFGTSVPVSISFANGKSITVPTVCQDLDRVSKIAVVWRQPVDLDLHVFERPAAPGAIGQINSARPGVRDTARDLSTTERAARGFLSTIGSARSYDGGDGVRMTVYTAFHPPQTTTQSVPVAIDFATRGEKAAAETCMGGKLANPSYEIVRLTARGQVTREDGQFAAFSCGSVVAPTLRFNQSLHAPLRIRN